MLAKALSAPWLPCVKAPAIRTSQRIRDSFGDSLSFRPSSWLMGSGASGGTAISVAVIPKIGMRVRATITMSAPKAPTR